MGDRPHLREVDVDVGEPPGRSSRSKSIMGLVFPIGVVVSIIGSAVVISFAVGQRNDKLDNVVEAVKEIKSEMYRRSDAEVLNVKMDNLDKRVTVLETARQQHVDRVTAKVEKQEDDLFTRAQHWITGSGKR
jgi:hypothetical protein